MVSTIATCCCCPGGRRGCGPWVNDIVLAKTPVPPHRIIGMHRYRVGEKYPFRDAANRIDDPKTTVAVGAALCVQAEGRLRNFLLQGEPAVDALHGALHRQDGQSTAKSGTENIVLLSNLDLDGEAQADDTSASR